MFDETFYIGMVERWINEYKNINKNNSILNQMNSKAIKKPNDYIMQLALMKINEIGINCNFFLIKLVKRSKIFY